MPILLCGVPAEGNLNSRVQDVHARCKYQRSHTWRMNRKRNSTQTKGPKHQESIQPREGPANRENDKETDPAGLGCHAARVWPCAAPCLSGQAHTSAEFAVVAYVDFDNKLGKELGLLVNN